MAEREGERGVCEDGDEIALERGEFRNVAVAQNVPIATPTPCGGLPEAPT